jgi:hypothetical protein
LEAIELRKCNGDGIDWMVYAVMEHNVSVVLAPPLVFVQQQVVHYDKSDGHFSITDFGKVVGLLFESILVD